MTANEIWEYCLKELEGTVLASSWGERGIFYNPYNKLKRGIYVLTVKEKDGCRYGCCVTGSRRRTKVRKLYKIPIAKRSGNDV